MALILPITAIEKTDYERNYMPNKASFVAQRYWSFVEAVESEVTETDENGENGP